MTSKLSASRTLWTPKRIPETGTAFSSCKISENRKRGRQSLTGVRQSSPFGTVFWEGNATKQKSWRKFKGQHDRGNRTESLWEGNLPLRGSLRGSLRGRGFSEIFHRFSEVLRDFKEIFERFSEIFERFSEVLSETLSEADFPLRGSQSCCPYSCCPLNFLQKSVKKNKRLVTEWDPGIQWMRRW